jgi:hypothetical protein
LNMLLSDVLQLFREQNGRGPNTRELLDLRKQVADQLGLADSVKDLDEIEQEISITTGTLPSRKRKPINANTNLDNENITTVASKRVKFDPSVMDKIEQVADKEDTEVVAVVESDSESQQERSNAGNDSDNDRLSQADAAAGTH